MIVGSLFHRAWCLGMLGTQALCAVPNMTTPLRPDLPRGAIHILLGDLVSKETVRFIATVKRFAVFNLSPFRVNPLTWYHSLWQRAKTRNGGLWILPRWLSYFIDMVLDNWSVPATLWGRKRTHHVFVFVVFRRDLLSEENLVRERDISKEQRKLEELKQKVFVQYRYSFLQDVYQSAYNWIPIYYWFIVSP